MQIKEKQKFAIEVDAAELFTIVVALFQFDVACLHEFVSENPAKMEFSSGKVEDVSNDLYNELHGYLT